MPTCQSCGAINRQDARFCYQCAARITQRSPSSDDQAWLAATLSTTAASPSEAPTRPRKLTAAAPVVPPPAEDEGVRMDQTQPPTMGQPGNLFAGRYEIVAQNVNRVEALDHQPWKRCWACGATSNDAGELFCTECGANLEGRRYRGELIGGEPAGLALVPALDDAAAREVLPPIWDQVRGGDGDQARLLTLVADSARAPVAPPLEELQALYVGRGLAHLLNRLHAAGLALGPIGPDDVELTAAELPRLRAAPGLRRIGADDAAARPADLRALAGLLESLTATPRTTRKLTEAQVTEIVEMPGLADVLRELRTGSIASADVLAERLDDLIAERTEPTPLWTRIGAASHPGMVRELDEDSLLTLDLRNVQNSRGRSWGLFIVADGMGGHAAGEVASGLAIRGAAEVVLSAYLTPTLDADAPYDEAQIRDVVRRAIQQGNQYVLNEARARGNDMGTTITMALVAGDRAVIGNVGDSRTYLYRDGALRRITKDHSLVMRLVDLGQITEEDIYTHPQRNAVLRSMGDKPDVEIDLFTLRLRPGDALFLCCDGQWEMTRDPQMAEIIGAHDNPQAACDTLISAANNAGGDDNITSVLVKFERYGE
ncbi:MAG: protein phosphatase 2C domain-containing protein [Kouleothrix sp.]|nr:protein phosphatase 2C domain-containing protein [Kouleothrix sp.]